MQEDKKQQQQIVSEDASNSFVEEEYDDGKSMTFWQKLIKTLEVQPKGELSTAQMFLYNHDLLHV